LIDREKFTYPTLVWWAWADVACRAGNHSEAATALARLRQLRPGNDQRHHEALVQARLGHVKKARQHLALAPPHGFITPFVKGLIAMKKGQKAKARKLLLEARGAAIIEERKQSVDAALEKLKNG